MVKAISAHDVEVRDVILLHEEDRLTVEQLERQREPQRVVIQDGFRRVSLAPDVIVGLLHRPYEAGKTEQDMLLAIDEVLINFWVGRGPWQAALTAVQQAIEKYELGKPLAEVPEKAQPPVQATAIVFQETGAMDAGE